MFVDEEGHGCYVGGLWFGDCRSGVDEVERNFVEGGELQG